MRRRQREDLRSRRRPDRGRVRNHRRRHALGARLRGRRQARDRDLRRPGPAPHAGGSQARAGVPQRGRRRPQAAHGLSRALRRGRGLLRRRRSTEPADRRPAGRHRGAPRRRAEPRRRHPGGPPRVRHRVRGRRDGSRSVARARRRRPRDGAGLHPDLLPLRDPLRPHAQGPGRVGEGPLRPRRAHPRPRRRRRGALGPDPHARGRDADREQQGPGRPARAARQGPPPPLHLHLPALRRDQPRGGLLAAGGDARRDVPQRDRRDRPADEPRSASTRSRTRSSTTGSTTS